MYIGSADLMERNLDRRVETLTPVRDAEIVAHLRDVVLAAYLRDTDRAMMLDAAGRYTKPDAAAGRFNAMEFLLKQPPTSRTNKHKQSAGSPMLYSAARRG